ncbi:MAG: hypothetical protein ABEH78_05575 [Haloferacaceae archaeon]
MLDEDSPHEPDEFDPEEQWGSPGEKIPSVPSPPEPEVTEADVDPELLGLWWRSVALANVALGGVAIGLMVIGFRGMWVPGLAGIALGLLAGGRLYQHYRAFQQRGDGDVYEDSDGDADRDSTGDDGEGSGDGAAGGPPVGAAPRAGSDDGDGRAAPTTADGDDATATGAPDDASDRDPDAGRNA